MRHGGPLLKVRVNRRHLRQNRRKERPRAPAQRLSPAPARSWTLGAAGPMRPHQRVGKCLDGLFSWRARLVLCIRLTSSELRARHRMHFVPRPLARSPRPHTRSRTYALIPPIAGSTHTSFSDRSRYCAEIDLSWSSISLVLTCAEKASAGKASQRRGLCICPPFPTQQSAPNHQIFFSSSPFS